MRKAWLLIGIVFPIALVAKEPLIIHSWGTAALLAKAFNAVASIFKNDDFSKNLITFAVSVGLFCALLKTIFSSSIKPLWKLWFIPTSLTLTLFVAPTEKIVIYDHLIRIDSKQKVYNVDNVPWLMAYAGFFLNNIGEGLKDLLTDHLHGVNDPIYNWTGQMFGGESLLKTRKPKIIDGTAKKNLRRFCQSCVAVDLDLGLYTLKDLEEQTDVLRFLIDNTSDLRARSFNYQYSQADKEAMDIWPEKKEKPLIGDTVKISCKNGARLIQDRLRDNLYQKETREILLGMLGNHYHTLFNLSKHSSIQQLIEQQVAIDALKNYTYGKPRSFAAKRGEQIQYEQGKTLAQMATTSIVYMYGGIQVVIYLLFPVVIVLGLCFLGFKAIFGWLFLLSWVSLWPSIFVIVQALANWIWETQIRTKHLANQGYNLITSDAFFDLYTFVEGWVGFLLVLIAPLSMALLYLAQKGSASTVAHLLGGVGSSMQGAANIAAGEAATGNYHYRNVADNNLNAGNRSIMQQNMAPTYRGGMMSMMGVAGETVTDSQGDQQIVKENISQLADTFSSSEIAQVGLQGQISAAEEKMKGATTSFHREVGKLTNLSDGFQEHHAANLAAGKGYSDQTTEQMLEQSSQALAFNKDVAEKWGISTEKAFTEALGLGLKFGIGGDASLRKNYSDLYGKEGADRYNDMIQLYDSYQRMTTLAASEDFKIGEDNGLRQYKDFAESWNRAHKFSEQESAAFNERESAIDTLSQLKNDTLTLNQNLNNEFVDWIAGKGNNVGKTVLGVLQDRPLRDQLAREFFQEKYPDGYKEPAAPDVHRNESGEVDLREGFEQDKEALANQANLAEVDHKLEATKSDVEQKKRHLGKVRAGAQDIESLFAGNRHMEPFRRLFASINRLSPEEMKRIRGVADEAIKLRVLPPKEGSGDPQPGLVKQNIEQFKNDRTQPFLARALKQSTVLNAIGEWLGFTPKKDKDGKPLPREQAEIISAFATEHLSDEERMAIIEAKTESFF